MGTALTVQIKTAPSGLLRGREARERVTVECLGLPRRAVPLAVLISNDRDGDDDAVAAELVGGGDAVVEPPFGTHGELDRARQFVIPVTDNPKIPFSIA